MVASRARWLVSALLLPSLVCATCYRPDGTAVDDPAVQPCNQDDGNAVSMCCSLNRTSYPDQCLSNGLCGGGGNVFRDSCTDQSWKSPLCLNLCTTGGGTSGTAIGVSEETFLNYTESDVQVTDCNDGSYCCGPKNTTCCNLGEGKRISSILKAPSSTKSIASTTSVEATATVSSTSGSTPSAIGASTPSPSNFDSGSSSGLSKGAIAGIAVGSILAAIIVGAAAAWCLWRKRRRVESSNPAELDPHGFVPKHVIHEKPVPNTRTELWDQEPRVELDTASRRAHRIELAG